MSVGKKVRGPAAPKSVEVKGPMTNTKASNPKAPAMSNRNSGTSSPSTKGSESATNAGMKGTSFDPHVVVENTKGHLRNQGSALRGGASRKSSHDSGNRYGK